MEWKKFLVATHCSEFFKRTVEIAQTVATQPRQPRPGRKREFFWKRRKNDWGVLVAP